MATRGATSVFYPELFLRVRDEACHLPPPVTAFFSVSDMLGLLIRSATPCIGLTYREPRSVIHPIGVLIPGGMEPHR